MSRAMSDDPAVNPVRPLDPTSRRRRPIPDYDAGVVLADGQTWVLARTGLAPILTPIRDRLFDDSTLHGEVAMGDIVQAAWVCLLAHYDLSDSELAMLLSGLTEDQERALVQATSDAVLGPNRPFRTYTDWVLASLHANGLDPEKIPPVVLPDVLDILVRTGRTAPEDEWTSAGIASAKRSRLMATMQQSAREAAEVARRTSNEPSGPPAEPRPFATTVSPESVG